jgi:hypothetical protein
VRWALVVLAIAACSKKLPYPAEATTTVEHINQVVDYVERAARQHDCTAIDATLGWMTIELRFARKRRFELEIAGFLDRDAQSEWYRWLAHDYKPRIDAAVAALEPSLQRCKIDPIDTLAVSAAY